MKINIKFLYSFLFVLFLFIIFNLNSSFAMDLTVNDVTYNLPDISTVCDYEYQCIIFTSSKFYLYDSKLPLVFDSDNKYCLDSSITSNTVKRYQFTHVDNGHKSTEWELMASVVDGNYVTTGQNINLSFSFVPNVVYSNNDIYLSSGELFFQAPVTGVVIPALETAQQIPETIVKTLKILIPVGLVVLAVGLIIYLIKRVTYSTQ